MNNTNQRLISYIKEQVAAGFSVKDIHDILLTNDWTENTINEAFSELGIDNKQHMVTNTITETSNSANPATRNILQEKTFAREGITMDKIIEKFIPIAGAIFLIVGFGYLLYANAWVHLPMEIRIGLGFFFSVAIIGGSFSLAEKMRYFTDIGIGSGILLMYATLIYGSRTTEIATAMIPEAATLFTAMLFTICMTYFASKRNSKVILILGMIGAYITPFVIGQNDVWVDNVSFNAYLIYFIAVNVAVFLIGKEISVRDIIPLNIAGLFIGVSTLWGLAYSNGINATQAGNFFAGELFTAILFTVLVVFSIWSILLSAKKFAESDDGYLSLGYIAPVIWFVFNINNLDSITDITTGIMYMIIAVSCFAGWHILSGTKTKFQHTALYVAGLLSAFLAIFSFFEEFNVYTSIFIAYSSLIFGILHTIDSKQSERFIGYIIVSLTGSILSLKYILEANSSFETILIVISLLPAMSAYLIAKNGSTENLLPIATTYSFLWATVASMFVLAEIVDYIDIDFFLFYLMPLVLLSYLALNNKTSHDSKSTMFRIVLFWFAFGFISVFFTLVNSIYPAPTNTYLFTHPNYPTDWIMVKAIFATAILFLGLFISRKLQLEQIIKRPSFLLVIFSFSTLLLTGNYIISAIANDIGVSLEHGGPRAIATTLWWTAIAIYMLYQGLKFGKKYHAEKLLGLMLLGITLIKVILYDIATMEMQNKIVVLMMVGGAMLLFSYMIRSKDLLKSEDLETRDRI